MRERDFQKSIIKEIKKKYPGCVVLKNDANYIQGFPDLLILFGKHWAALEVKKHAKAHHQPNQDYYISKLDGMSLARFIYPENKKEVFDALAQLFEPKRISRFPVSKQFRMGKLRQRETLHSKAS